MRVLLLLLGVVGLMASGQILFKLAAKHMNATGEEEMTKFVMSLLLNPPLIIGGIIYLATTVLWVLVLREVELSRAYPATALTLVLVSAAGVVIFEEPLTLKLAAGSALIIAGVLVMGSDIIR